MDEDIFNDMHETLFAALGKEGFLRAGESCQVEMREGEEIIGTDGTVVTYDQTADIWYKDKLAKPRAGDQLVFNSITYTLDFMVRDDGYSARWVLVDRTP